MISFEPALYINKFFFIKKIYICFIISTKMCFISIKSHKQLILD